MSQPETFVERRMPDPYFMFSALALMVIGVIFIFSSSSIVGSSNFGDPYYFVKRHVVFLLIGLVSAGAFYIFGPSRARRFSGLLYLGSLISLLLVYIPGLGMTIGGATRWVNLGFMSFQPSELLKITVPLYVAHALANKGERANQFFKGVLPVLLVAVIPVALVLRQPDLGTVLVIVATMMAMIWSTGLHWAYFGVLFGTGLVGGVLNIAAHPYQMDRVKAFIDPWSDPQGISFHVLQSWNAIGNGGLLGQGLGNSKIKYFYLPQQYTDFIFAVVCEEGGFIISTCIILLLMVLAARSFRIAILHQDPFKRYLATGLATYIVGQSLVNIGVVVGLLPTTGIPLPLISFGGTSLMVTCMALGWLARLSTEV